MENGHDDGFDGDDGNPMIVEAIILAAQAGALRSLARNRDGEDRLALIVTAKRCSEAASKLLTDWARAVAAAGPSDVQDEE